MHHRPLRNAFVIEHAQDVGMRVAVVDDERAVQLLGQPDVIAERLLLRGPAVRSGSEVIESGLPHRANVRVGGKRSDFGERRLVVVAQARGVVRVQGDGGHNGREFTRRLNRPA